MIDFTVEELTALCLLCGKGYIVSANGKEVEQHTKFAMAVAGAEKKLNDAGVYGTAYDADHPISPRPVYLSIGMNYPSFDDSEKVTEMDRLFDLVVARNQHAIQPAVPGNVMTELKLKHISAYDLRQKQLYRKSFVVETDVTVGDYFLRSGRRYVLLNDMILEQATDSRRFMPDQWPEAEKK